MNELTEYLYTYFDEVEPKEFYRNIFPKGELQEQGEEHYNDGKYNGVIIEITDEKYKDKKGRDRNVVKKHILTDDLDKIDEVCTRDNFCLMSAVSYYGKHRFNDNARNMYALVIELDGLLVKDGKQVGIVNLFHQIEVIERIPKPTYIVSSGNGLHLYYVLEKALPLFKNVFEQVERLKKELTRIIWFDGITSLSDDVQYEPITQGFRVVGTATKKKDKEIRARAFETGEKVSIEYLNEFVNDESKVTEFTYKSKLTLSQAKKEYPEWYDKRIEKQEEKGSWTCNRAVYEWWKQKIYYGAKCGRRYWCLRVLSIYGAKCGVDYQEVEDDVFSYLDFMDSMTKEGFDPFTEYDCIKALDGYQSNWKTYPIDNIIHRTGIHIEKNKRNYQKQEWHLEDIRSKKANMKRRGQKFKNPEGRPSKEQIVKQWKIENPNGKKADCIRDTGLTKPTVYKWWE